MSNIVVREIKAKTILSKSRIYGVQYSINPYIGCTHGCVYCYARFTFIARNIRSDLWGKIIFPKINAPKLLLEEIKHRRKGTVLLSSVTDAYNNLEKKYNLTKRIIEILKKRHWPIVILTKSDLILRDLSILAGYDRVEAGITITLTDDEFLKIFEPSAPRFSDRINALRVLNQTLGDATYAFVGPLLPIFGEKDLDYIFSEISNLGIKRVLFDKLNIKAENWITINRALETLQANRKEFWKKTKDFSFWQKIKKKVIYLSKKYGVTVDFCY